MTDRKREGSNGGGIETRKGKSMEKVVNERGNEWSGLVKGQGRDEKQQTERKSVRAPGKISE